MIWQPPNLASRLCGSVVFAVIVDFEVLHSLPSVRHHRRLHHDEKKSVREIGKAGKIVLIQLLLVGRRYLRQLRFNADSDNYNTIARIVSCLLLSTSFNLFYNVEREMNELEETHGWMMRLSAGLKSFY